jgi:phosphoribosyl-ATP pyrophosphohydrolase
MSDAPLDRLFAIIASRRDGDPAKSYTAGLLRKGVTQCARKFGEESLEAVIAAISGDKVQLTAESADVLYHLLVLWAAAGIAPADIYAVLKEREKSSGLQEKAGRGAI